MTAKPPNPPTTPEQFRRRLGYYLVGLAVGCVLLGLLQVARSREAARIRQERGLSDTAQSTAPPEPPSGPK